MKSRSASETAHFLAANQDAVDSVRDGPVPRVPSRDPAQWFDEQDAGGLDTGNAFTHSHGDEPHHHSTFSSAARASLAVQASHGAASLVGAPQGAGTRLALGGRLSFHSNPAGAREARPDDENLLFVELDEDEEALSRVSAASAFLSEARYHYERSFYLFDKLLSRSRNQVVLLAFIIATLTLIMGKVIQVARNYEIGQERGYALRRYYGLTLPEGMLLLPPPPPEPIAMTAPGASPSANAAFALAHAAAVRRLLGELATPAPLDLRQLLQMAPSPGPAVQTLLVPPETELLLNSLVECDMEQYEMSLRGEGRPCLFPAPPGSVAPDRPPHCSYAQGVWLAWHLFIDPSWGTWPDLGVSGVVLRAVTMVHVITGILYVATIVGIVVDAVAEKMVALQKGRTAVQERGHSVILGWNNSALTVIEELSNANESEGGGCIVVLSHLEKPEMESDLRTMFRDKASLKGTRCVFRTGSRLNTHDLRFVAVEKARSILVLSQPIDANLADAEMVQAVMCISTIHLQPECNVVAEVKVHDNEGLVKVVGSEAVTTLSSHAIIGSLMLLFMRHPGLNRVYKEVLGFEGNELYVRLWDDSLEGRAWHSVALHFADAIPLGVRRADGAVILNPPPSFVLSAGDSLIVLAEDDDTYEFNSVPMELGEEIKMLGEVKTTPPPDVFLFAGWRREVALMVLDLDGLVSPGTELYMLCETSVEERERQFEDHGVDEGHLQNLTILHRVGSPGVRRVLETLPVERLTGAIVFCSEGEGVANSDSACLSTLMLLRGIQVERMRAASSDSRDPSSSPRGGELAEEPSFTPGQKWSDAEGRACMSALNVLVEILDPRTQSTVRNSYSVWSVAEFIHSNEVVSQMLAMVSEEGSVMKILEQLVGMTGTQFAILPAEGLINASTTTSFARLAHSLLKRRIILCGYIEQHLNLKTSPKLVINPPEKEEPRRWRGCQLVVINSDLSYPHHPEHGAGGADIQRSPSSRSLSINASGSNRLFIEGSSHGGAAGGSRQHSRTSATPSWKDEAAEPEPEAKPQRWWQRKKAAEKEVSEEEEEPPAPPRKGAGFFARMRGNAKAKEESEEEEEEDPPAPSRKGAGFFARMRGKAKTKEAEEDVDEDDLPQREESDGEPADEPPTPPPPPPPPKPSLKPARRAGR